MSRKNPFLSSLSLFTVSSLLCAITTRTGTAATYHVTSSADNLSYPGTSGTLRWAMNSATAPGDTITFAPGPFTINLNAPLPPVNTSVTFDATGNAGVAIDGQNKFQAFFFTAGASTFQNFTSLKVENCLAQGGTGGRGGLATSNSAGSGGGGGGLGAGGAFFVFTGAEVTMATSVADLQINSCSAQGGDGGAGGGSNGGSLCTGGGGGGGIRSIDTLGNNISGAKGGDVSQPGQGNGTGGGGAGGLGGLTGSSSQLPTAGSGNTNSSGGTGGVGSGPGGGLGGAPGTSVSAPPGNGAAGGSGGQTGAGGGGAGGGAFQSGLPNVGGGGTGGTGATFAGGGGGGGGNASASAGTGLGGAAGFGGGGGGAGLSTLGLIGGALGGPGGPGGFGGGGGGGGMHSAGGTSVFGGGAGGSSTNFTVTGAGGGGGAGLGGALFVAQGATFTMANITALSGSVSPGQGGVGNTGAQGGSPGATAGSQVFLMSSGTLGVNIASNVSFGGTIASNLTQGGGDYTSGGLMFTGAGILTLTGTNNYTGSTTIDGSGGGALRVSSSSNLGFLGNGSGGIILQNGGELQVDTGATPVSIDNPITIEVVSGSIQPIGTATVTIANPITENPLGSGLALNVNAGGILAVQSGNTYSGNTNIYGSTLIIPDPTALGTGGAGVTLAFDGGTLQNGSPSLTLPQTVSLGMQGGTFSIVPDNANVFTTLTGQITGPGALSVNGNQNASAIGILSLQNLTNNYTGDTSVTDGILIVTDAAQLGSSTNLFLTSGTLSTLNNVNLPSTLTVHLVGSGGGAFNLSGNTSTIQGQIVGGSVGSPVPLTFEGGTAILTNTTNNYVGPLTLNSATVQTQGPGSTLGNSNPINFLNNSSLFLNSAINPIPSVITTGNTTGSGVSVANFQLNGNSFSLSGQITDFSPTQTGGIQVTGLSSADTLTLGNTSNIYTGPTIISVGTLSLGNPGSIGLSSQVQFLGGTLATTSSLTLPNPIVIGSGGGTIDLGTNSSLLSGTISGSNTMAVTNGGTLTLSGANTGFTGGVNVQGSTLNIANGYNIGSGTLTLNNSTLTPTAPGMILPNPVTATGTATFNVDVSNTLTLSGAISGTGGVTKTGSSTLTLSAPNSYAGSTNINGGTLIIPDSTALGTGGAGVTLGLNAGTLQTENSSFTLPQTVSLGIGGGTFSIMPTLTANVFTTLSGQVTGSGALSVNGNPTGVTSGGLSLQNLTNNYTGDTSVTDGILIVTDAAQLGSSTNLFLTSGTLSTLNNVNLPSTLTVHLVGSGGGAFNLSGNTSTIQGQIVGGSVGSPVPLTFEGGTAILTNTTNNYVGPLTLNSATVQTQGPGSTLGNSNPINFLNNSSLFLNSAINPIPSVITTGNTTGSGVSVANFQLNGNSFSLSGQITDFSPTQTGGIQVTGLSSTDTLTLSNANNTYTGPTIISVGTLSLSDPGSIGSSSQVQFLGGTLATTSSLTLPNPIVIGSGGGTIDLGTNSSLLSGTISGSNTMAVTNGGTLTLSGANTGFTGGVNVQGSTLNIANGYNIGSGTLTLNNSTLTPTAPGVTASNLVTATGTATFNVDMSNTLTLSGTISGTGGVTKIGSNTLTLSAPNSYSGPTNINGGTVSISSATTPLGTNAVLNITGATLQTTTNSSTLPQTITLSGTTAFDVEGAITTTLSGAVGGATTLNKTGSGTLSLTNSNGYTSDTNINDGILAISNATTPLGVGANINITASALETNTNSFTLSQTVNLSGGSTITVDGAITTTMSGQVTGSGGLTKNGTGELLFTFNGNNYTGGSDVRAGTFAISQATSFPTLTNLSIGSGGAFDMSAGGITTISVAELQNSTVVGGSLLLGANNLSINSPTLSVFSGAISGTGGSITQNGPGVLSLFGNSSYTGGTTINNSILSIIADHNLGASTGQVNFNAGTLEVLSTVNSARTFDLTTGNGTIYSLIDTILSGASVFTGSNIFTKTGPGTLNLTGPSAAFIGSVQLNAGTLAVNANLPVPVTVNASGTLKGVGPVGSALSTLTNNGVVKPGNSIGTMVVPGNYLQGAGGELDIELNGDGTTDLLQIGGTATLAGNLTVIPLQGPFFGNGPSYTVLTAVGGLGGSTFSSFNTGGIDLSIAYNPNSVVLQSHGNHFFVQAPVIKEHNPKKVEEYLESLQYFQNGQPIPSQENLIGVIIDIVKLGSSSKITKALDQLHPAQFGEFGLLNSDLRSLITSILNQNSREDCCRHLIQPMQCNNSSLWIEPFGMRIMQKAGSGQRGFESESGGVMIGGDYCFQNNILLGLAVGGNTSYLKWTGKMGNAHLPSGFAALYADWSGRRWALEASVLGGLDFFRTRRHIHFTGVHRNAKSHHRGFDWNAHLGASGDIRAGAFFFEPFANFDYSYLHQNGFSEHGASSLNLKVESKSFGFFRAEEGISFLRSFKTHHGCWSPRAWISLVTSVPLYNRNYRSSLVGQSGSFTVWTYHKTNNRVAPGFELLWSINQSVGLSARYGAEFGKNICEQRGDFRFEWDF